MIEVTLRPLSLGEILDAAVGLYRRNFWLLVGIITLAEIPLIIGQILLPLIFQTKNEDVSSLYWLLTNAANGLVRWVFVDGFGAAALSYALAQRYLHQPVSIFAVYRRLASSFFSLAGMLFLSPILLFIALVWVFVPCVGWLSSAGILLFLSMAVLPLIPVVVMVENRFTPGAILRAWDLARRRFFWLLGFNLVMGIFGWLLAVGPSLVAATLAAALLQNSFGAAAETLYGPVFSVSGTLFNMLFLPIQVGAWTLIYYDVRVRTEAFDLALLITDELEHVNRQTSLPAVEKWLSGRDIAKILLTSLFVALLFVLVYLLPILLIFILAALSI